MPTNGRIYWPEKPKYEMNQMGVAEFAPPLAGVYGLYSGGTWIFIRNSYNIQRELTRILAGGHPVPVLSSPLEGFAFRVMSHDRAAALAAKLVALYRPFYNLLQVDTQRR